MEESKAISPEVKGLFSTVRAQAKEYTKAFERLEIEISRFEALKTELSKVPDQIRYEVNNTIQELRKNVDDSIELLEVKFDTISNIYNDIESIRSLRDELSDMSKKLNNQTVEINNIINNFRARSEAELKSFIAEIRQKIDDEMAQHSAKTENKMNIKIRKLEGKLLTFDQKLWSVSNTQNYEFKNLLSDFNALKADVVDPQDVLETFDKVIKRSASNFIKEHAKDLIGDLLAMEKKEINDNISKIKQFFNQKNINMPGKEKDKEATYFDDFSFDLNTIINKNNANERMINSLKKEINTLNHDMNDIYKSKNIALIIAGLSLSGMLIMAIILAM